MNSASKYPQPVEYMNMPVGFLPKSDDVVVLSQAIEGTLHFDSFGDLTPDKQMRLIVAVLRGCDNYEVYAMGEDSSSIIHRDRAVYEVEQGSIIGKQIIENEGQLIMTLLRRFAPAQVA